MAVHYYLSIFPTNALIASELEPEKFGAYMATGAKNGSHERIIFIEVEGGFKSDFDWEYAQKKCVPHDDGRPKNSVWLSVYRALEHTPLSAMGSLYLTTPDGRSLKLNKRDYADPGSKARYHVYNELCPITPLVVSTLDPVEFAAYMTDPDNKVSVPKVAFADLKTIDLDNLTNTGNVGPTYDRNIDHLKSCVAEVVSNSAKKNKNIERSNVDGFTYNVINSGVYLSDGTNTIEYPMPSEDDLRRHYYDWARSAQIF